MKKMFFALVLVSMTAKAQTDTLYVSNFNFDYTNPQGRGSAENLGSKSSLRAAVDLLVDRVDREFKLTVLGDHEAVYDFKNAPDFMVDAERMAIRSFNLNLVKERLNASLAAGTFESRKDNLRLDGLSLDCARASEESTTVDQLLQGCTQALTFKLSKFVSSESISAFEEVLDLPRGGSVQVSSLELKIRSKKFDLSGEVRAQVSGKVKASGQMSYESQRGQLAIKISEVKFGFLNITSKVFDELKKNESDRFTVKEPYVYYQLK